MDSPDLFTRRLRLVTLSARTMDADRTSATDLLATLLNAEVPRVWPPEHWEPHCFAFIEAMRANHPQTFGWNRYVVVRGTPEVLIGTVGAFPRTSQEAEIGYSILAPWQRHGYATEAAQALIAELWNDPSIDCITGQTFPHLTASVCVMQRCGMQTAGAGDEPGTVRYRLARNTSLAPPPEDLRPRP